MTACPWCDGGGVAVVCGARIVCVCRPFDVGPYDGDIDRSWGWVESEMLDLNRADPGAGGGRGARASSGSPA